MVKSVVTKVVVSWAEPPYHFERWYDEEDNLLFDSGPVYGCLHILASPFDFSPEAVVEYQERPSKSLDKEL